MIISASKVCLTRPSDIQMFVFVVFRVVCIQAHTLLLVIRQVALASVRLFSCSQSDILNEVEWFVHRIERFTESDDITNCFYRSDIPS